MKQPWTCLALVALVDLSALAGESQNLATPSEVQVRNMEQLATPAQVGEFTQRTKRDCYVFGEDRVNSIRRHDALPAHWLDGSAPQLERFTGTARLGELCVSTWDLCA